MILRRRRVRIREPLTDEQCDLLVRAVKGFDEQLVIFTLLDTGMRVSEFCSLTRDSVEWQRELIIVVGKGGKRRVVPLSDRVKRLFEIYFTNRNEIGLNPRGVQRIVLRVANRAGIARRVHPHILRHTFAVHSLRRGISLKTLQLVLGHSSLETTDIYLNISGTDVLREYKEKFREGLV